MNKALESKYNCNFHWDDHTKTWCISGQDRNKNYYESDDFEAKDLQDALLQAQDYLEAYNSIRQ